MATQAPIDAAAPLKIKSPIKLVHVVFRTSRMTEMLAWYKKVLNATEAFVGENISFLAYDDEYHSVAFIEIPALAKQPAGQVGVHHVAFTYNGPDTLLSNYERLKRRGSSRSGRSTMAPRSRSMTLTPTGTSWGFRSIPTTRSRRGAISSSPTSSRSIRSAST